MAEFASRGVGNTALGLSIGALGAQALAGGLGNLFGGTTNVTGIADTAMNLGDHYVTQKEMGYIQQLNDERVKNAIITSEQASEIKIADVYSRLKGDLLAMERNQNAINQEQAVYNGVNTATLGCIKNQVAELRSLAVLKIPNSSVCPGWGNVEVTPV